MRRRLTKKAKNCEIKDVWIYKKAKNCEIKDVWIYKKERTAR